MATIEDLEDRIKNIENNLKFISDDILKQIKTIMKMEMKLEEKLEELKELRNKIKDFESMFIEFDLRIRHFETVYKRRSKD